MYLMFVKRSVSFYQPQNVEDPDLANKNEEQ